MNKLGLLLIAATAWGGQGHLRPSSKVEGAPVTADSEGGPMTTNLRPHATLEAFDYFLLELQWGITLCSDGTFNCETSALWFTLHGLWPERNDGSYPQNCPGAAYDANAIKDLLPLMNKYWPSLNGPSDAFWKHEWSTHGTCATDVFSGGEHDFFAGALQVLQRYDIVRALNASALNPSNTKGFSKTAFNNALTKAYGATAVLGCDSKGWISTAVQCISKDLTLMRCPANVASKCTANTVFLPATQV